MGKKVLIAATNAASASTELISTGKSGTSAGVEVSSGAAKRVLASLLAAAGLAHAPALGQPLAWQQVATAGPGGRNAPAMAYDSARNVVVLFGGATFSYSGYFQDTWEWDGFAWSLRATAGPSPRANTGFAFDPTRGVCVLHGGYRNTQIGETWEWDGTNWTQRATVGPTPGVRTDPAMAFDPVRGEVILFGGEPSNGLFMSDTWAWNGASWAQLAVAGPSPRYSHAMATDWLRDVIVLYGGGNGSFANLLDDTWEWDGTAWTQRNVAGFRRLYSFAMSFDPTRGLVVASGGAGPSAENVATFDGSRWSLVQGQLPGVGAGSRSAFHPLTGGVIAFGTANTTWALLPAPLVPFDSAGATQNATFTGVRNAPPFGVPQTIALGSLTVQPGGVFGLGPNETLNLAGGQGTLYVLQGGTFIGNGAILGSLVNSGLVIVPLPHFSTINRIFGPNLPNAGGVTRVIVPPPMLPGQPVQLPSPGPVQVGPGAFVVVNGGGFSGGDSGPVPPAPAPRRYVIDTPSVTSQGMVGFDGILQVSGSYTQTATGILRVYVAGTQRGVSYTALDAGTTAALRGELQVVLEPTPFGFVPAAGQSFDVLTAMQGISLPDGMITIRPLMSAAGLAALGITLPTYDSGYAADPDRQLYALPSGLFDAAVVEGGTTLRLTQTQSIDCLRVTEPISVVICPQSDVTMTVDTYAVQPTTFNWEFRNLSAQPPTDWTALADGSISFADGFTLSVSGASTSTIVLSPQGSEWPEGNAIGLPEIRCSVANSCGTKVTTPAGIDASLCDCIDFNNDGLFPDDADLLEFLTVLAGGECSPGNTCNDIDFNNDGLFPDDADLLAFLTLLAGGAC